MYGMNKATGTSSTGLAHLRQSVVDILTTPLGSRAWRRDYGSRLPDLIDKPLNSLIMLDIYTASAEALAKWEPRFNLKKVKYGEVSPDFGFASLILYGDIIADALSIKNDIRISKNKIVTVEVPLLTHNANPALCVMPMVEYSPQISYENNHIMVTLANDSLIDYPVQLSINGVLHEQFTREGSRILHAEHNFIDDQITAYYYVRGVA